MWIFASEGFISIVEDYEQPGNLLCRARSKNHLEAIFPGEAVKVTPVRDYRFRVSVPRAAAVKVVTDLASGIDYNNFKDSIPDDVYHDACSEVWGVMYKYQRGQK